VAEEAPKYPPRQSWETRIALLEQVQGQHEKRMDGQDVKLETLAKQFDDRFDSLEAHVVDLKNKNPIMDFVKENWKAVSFILILVIGQPSLDVVKLLVKVLFPQLGLQ
jgi:hypothetical protein